ncbi:MAG TPA: ABC-2 family transporter protein [Lacipirellulaceae bacterium]|nr:ABC-2 family transporter protein [Lacipirellulaceae bacterium]
MSPRPSYFRVFLTFIRNSLVRDMMFPTNFVIETVSSFGWVMMNIGFYLLIFTYTNRIQPAFAKGDIPTAVAKYYDIGREQVTPELVERFHQEQQAAAWDEYQFFVFIATSMFINSIVQMFFMTNAEEFSELIRTGGLDFALLKPIDTQFLISLRKVEWSSLANFLVAVALMAYALPRVEGFVLTPWRVFAYLVYVAGGIGILYSLTIVLAAASVWLGRNTSIYDFWFYITTFSRYPMEIYQGPIGGWIRWGFTFVLPILIVVNVPARLLAKPMQPAYWYLAAFALVATAASLAVSRWVFQMSLVSYRSASS